MFNYKICFLLFFSPGMFLYLFAELTAQGVPSEFVKSSDVFQFDALRVVLLEVVERPLQPGHGVKVFLQRTVIAAHRASLQGGFNFCKSSRNFHDIEVTFHGFLYYYKNHS